MPKSVLPVQNRIWTVRADLSIAECVRILKDHGVGALVVLSENHREEIVGIFTERDLVRHFELIRKGDFFDTPVRTVMTTNVRTVTLAELHKAPSLMALHHIRHLPVVAKDGTKTRVVGVLSMRDVFRYVMDGLEFDLSRVFQREGTVKKRKKRMIAVYSADPSIHAVVKSAAKITKGMLVSSGLLKANLEDFEELFERFEALFVDIDGLSPVDIAKLIAVAKGLRRKNSLYIAFSPADLSEQAREELHKIAKQQQVQLLSKPIALGLFFEKILLSGKQ